MRRVASIVMAVLCAVAAFVSGVHAGDCKRVGNLYHWRNLEDGHSLGPESFSVWVPDTADIVKGLFFLGSHGLCPGANNRDFVWTDTAFQSFARQFGFGMLGTNAMCGMQYWHKQTNILKGGLEDMAAIGDHPELQHVPLVVFGASGAGAAAYTLVNSMADRIICSTPTVPHWRVPEFGYGPGAGTVPLFMAIGELDGGYGAENWDRTVDGARNGLGALWAWSEIQGMGHEGRNTGHVQRVYWEKCIRMRYPADANPRLGPIDLIDIPEESGWLGCSDYRENGMATLAPFNEYTGEKYDASWMPDEDMAWLWRSLTEWHTPVIMNVSWNGRTISAYGDAPVNVPLGDNIRISVNDGGLSWSKVEFFRGSAKIGEVTSGTPELVYTIGDESIAQTFVVLVHTADRVYSAPPVGVGTILPRQVNAIDAPYRAVSVARKTTAAGATALYDLRGRTAARSRAYGAVGARVLVGNDGAGSRLVVIRR
ncbi:MAG: hypothetical protein GF331_23265 [Chitinivibrionales bacterium]|nr:hypothetical protein [Chitinivibrionales bacterium]